MGKGGIVEEEEDSVEEAAGFTVQKSILINSRLQHTLWQTPHAHVGERSRVADPLPLFCPHGNGVTNIEHKP